MSITFLLLLFSSCCTFSVSSAKNDRLALFKIKEQLGNPYVLSSWVKGVNFCNGSGNVEMHVYVSCTSTGRVNTLGFFSFMASYTFPQAICDLTELESLSIGRVYGFNGPVPSCIDKLVNLRVFYMHKTSLVGTVPEFLNNKKLTTIQISSSGLYGPIPLSLSAIPNLNYLDLSWNRLINGTIPSALVNNHPSASLILNNNRLSGEIPRCYGSVNYRTIDVSFNSLSGDASFLFGKHKTVTTINLSFNHQFEFDLTYVEIPENLTHLDLSYNRIYGKVPESLAWHPKLYLDLQFNRLCGELPQGGNISLYSSAQFAQNACLCGNPLSPCLNLAPAPAP